jgi:hypothetical protein
LRERWRFNLRRGSGGSTFGGGKAVEIFDLENVVEIRPLEWGWELVLSM